jgi:6-phosphogluconolactonase (cycloisomerase 2 family)/uncharacterized protein YjdB
MRGIVVLGRYRLILSFFFLAFTTAIAGCGGGSSVRTPPTLISIAVSPSHPSIPLGLTQQFTAFGTYSDGTTQDLSNSAIWSSETVGVVTISSTGLATSVAQGSSTITARSGAVSGSVTASAIAPVLASIAVSPGSASIAKGTTQQFSAIGTFSDKSQQTLSGVTWSSSPSSAASISPAGLATAIAVGTANITATSASTSGNASLTITSAVLVSIVVTPASPTVAAGLTQQFATAGIYSDDSSQPLSSLIWTVSDRTLASIDNNGLVTSLHPGEVTVAATSGSIQGTALLTILAPILTNIAISPASSTLHLGSGVPQQLFAEGTYSDKSSADITTQVDWTASNVYIASVSAVGSALPIRSGFTKVTATLDKLSVTAGLTVLSDPRYLYEVADTGRNVARLTVNAATGQLRHLGYQTTQEFDNRGLACISTDPADQYVYVTNVVPASSGSGYATAVSAYSVDSASGTLASMGAPYTLSESVGCLQFEPNGNFAYAVPAVSEATQQIVTLAKSSTGALSILTTTSLPDYAGGLAIDPVGQFLYVATQQLVANAKASAYGYRVNTSDGSLTLIDNMPLSLPTNTGALFSFSPSGDYLYMSDNNGTSVVGYSVDRTTGKIKAGAASVTPCINPSALRFTPDGTLAFVACGESIDRSPVAQNLVSLTIGANGSLTQVSTSSAYLSPTSVTVDPSGKYLYLISSGANYQSGGGSYSGGYNSVVTYSINSDGSTTELSETAGRVGEDSMILLGGAAPVTYSTKWIFLTDTAPATGIDPVEYQLKSFMPDALGGGLFNRESIGTLDFPFSLTTLPWGSDLLLASPQPAPNLQAFSFDNSTTLLTPGASFGTGTIPGAVILDPSGQTAFSSEPSTGLVYWYGYLNSAGQWGSLDSSPGVPASFVAEKGAGPLAMDPAGRYLFVANQTANSISEFEYAGAAPKAAYALPASPLAIATDPTGNLLFVVTKDNMLRMFVINVNGDFTGKADAQLPGTPTSVAVEPTGHYVYVTSSDGLTAFAIDQKKGTLTIQPMTLPMSLTGTKGVYPEPSGKYLYVIAHSDTFNNADGIYGFLIGSDGTLTAVSTITLAVLDNTTSVAFRTTVQ